MDTLINLWSYCLDYIKGIAENISVTFTGGDSGAILLLLGFYLTVLIVIISLFKLLIRTIAPKKKRSSKRFSTRGSSKKANKQESDSCQRHTEENHANSSPLDSHSNWVKSNELMTALSLMESFNEDSYLEQLSANYKSISGKYQMSDDPVLLDNSPPSPLSINISSQDLTSDEKRSLEESLEGENLSSLRKKLDEETKKETDLTFTLHSVKTETAKAVRERDSLVSQEMALCENYNTEAELFISANSEFKALLSSLEKSFKTVSHQISDMRAKRLALLEYLPEFADEIKKLDRTVNTFGLDSVEDLSNFSSSLERKDVSLLAVKESFEKASSVRKNADSDIYSKQDQINKLLKDIQVNKELRSILQSKVDILAKEEAERLAKEEAERVAREKAERLEREKAERQAREEAEKRAKEEAIRPEREAEREKQTQKEIMENIVKQTNSGYVLNFENLSPEALEKLAADINKYKSANASHSSSKEKSEQKLDVSENNADGEENSSAPVDHFAQVQQEWAAEREHKEAWADERAREQAEVQRRKEELLAKLNGSSANSGKTS